MMPKNTQNLIKYQVDLFDLAGHRLMVRLHIPKPNALAQKVFLPTWVPGSYLIRDFSRHVETFQARDKNGLCSVSRPDNHSWVVHNSSGAVDIDVIIYAWDLSVRGAHVDQHHAFFNGTSTFLCVAGQSDQACSVTITAPLSAQHWQCFTSMPPWAKAPSKRTRMLKAAGHVSAARSGHESSEVSLIDSGLNISPKTQTILGRYLAPNYDALIDYPFELGTPQTIDFNACGARHQLVFTGHVPNLDLARIKRDAQRICEAQIKLFEPQTQRAPFLDSAKHYTFMTMVTGDGYGGLEHRASTALMTARNSLPTLGQVDAPKGYDDFLGLLSHEYFHTWHVKRIKPKAFASYDLTQPNHTTLLWIFEGFTSYYDDLMLLRSGVMTDKQYLKRLGENITQVMTQPGRFKQSVAQSSFDAWTKYYKQDENAPNAIVSYYGKGALVALCLDLTIRHATQDTHSLDDVMRHLWLKFGKDFYQGAPIQVSETASDSASVSTHFDPIQMQARPLNRRRSQRVATGLEEDEFAACVLDATGVDLSQQITAWAHGTQDLPLKKCLAYAGYTMSWQPLNQNPIIEANVKPAGSALMISHVFEHGAAHQAGLSAHDVLIAMDGLKVGATRESLNHLLARYRPKDRVVVTVFRGDVLLTFDVILAAPAHNQCSISFHE